MSSGTVVENSRLLDKELLELEAANDAACVAQAIMERMSPEWRECVDQERRKHKLASSNLSEISRSSGAKGRVA